MKTNFIMFDVTEYNLVGNIYKQFAGLPAERARETASVK